MNHLTQQDLTDQKVQRKMASLETLADDDWDSACRQMIALYPSADKRHLHDICDGIDLWIFENKLTPNLAEHLRQLISEEGDVGLKCHYEGWLKR